MNEFIIFAVILIAMAVLFYLLWINGYMVMNIKLAVLFNGISKGKNKCEVSFSSCNGYMKKVIKFKENRVYTFNLDCDLSKGNVYAIIENKNKETLLSLTPTTKAGLLTVDKKCRYYLILKFEKAAGKLKLQWE